MFNITYVYNSLGFNPVLMTVLEFGVCAMIAGVVANKILDRMNK